MSVKRHTDHRGYFAEIYNARDFTALGIPDQFVQDNYSHSQKRGTVRGLHFQSPPHAQAKLIRVARGRILDVVVDLRRASSTYGNHETFDLKAEDDILLYVPTGFAHGFCTLTDDVEVHYKTTDYYAPNHDQGLYWADPDLAINWPVTPEQAIVSDKDAKLPAFKTLTSPFVGQGSGA